MSKFQRYLLTGVISFAIVYGLNSISLMFDNLLTIVSTLVIVDSLMSKDHSFPERILSSGLVFATLGMALTGLRIMIHLVMP